MTAAVSLHSVKLESGDVNCWTARQQLMRRWEPSTNNYQTGDWTQDEQGSTNGHFQHNNGYFGSVWGKRNEQWDYKYRLDKINIQYQISTADKTDTEKRIILIFNAELQWKLQCWDCSCSFNVTFGNVNTKHITTAHCTTALSIFQIYNSTKSVTWIDLKLRWMWLQCQNTEKSIGVKSLSKGQNIYPEEELSVILSVVSKWTNLIFSSRPLYYSPPRSNIAPKYKLVTIRMC